MRRTVIPTFCIVGLSLFLHCVEGIAQPLDIQQVENFLKEGKREEALFIIESLLEHLPAESDLLYLKGLVLPHEVSSLQKAIHQNNWKKYRDADARFLLVERYLRRKLFSEALSVLQGLQGGEVFPEYWYFLARIQFGKGNREEGFRTLKRAISLFPEDPRFLYLYFRHRDHVAPDDSILWEQIDPKKPYFLEAMAEYLTIHPDGEQRNTLLKEYLRLGGKDPKVVLPRPGAKEEEFETSWNQVKAFGGLSRIDVWEQVFYRFPTGKIRERLTEELNRYSGQLGKDSEGDGYVEEVRRFVEGNLTYLSVDADQDGEWDLEIDFLTQKPYRIQINRTKKETIQIFFTDYPRIDRILIQQEGYAQEYRYSIPPFIWNEGPIPAREENLPRGLAPVRMGVIAPFLAFSIREAKPYQKIETCSRCKRVRKFLYQEGMLLSFQEEQENRPGEIRKRTVTFREGSPFVGFIDLDGDGVADLRESYTNGVLDSIELLVGNRTVYREVLSMELKEWDFNGDGKVDAREYSLGRGRKMVEFASFLDSIFDEKAWVDSR